MSNDYWNRPTPDGEMNDKRPDQANGPAAEGSWEPNSLANDETRYGPAADGDESQTPYGPAGNTNYNTYGPTDGADFSGNEQPGAGEIPAGEHRGNQPHDPSVINHQQGAQPLNYSQDPTLTRNGTETPYGPVADQVMTPYGPAGNENYDSYGPTDGADYAGYGQQGYAPGSYGDQSATFGGSYGDQGSNSYGSANYGQQAYGSGSYGDPSASAGTSGYGDPRLWRLHRRAELREQ